MPLSNPYMIDVPAKISQVRVGQTYYRRYSASHLAFACWWDNGSKCK